MKSIQPKQIPWVKSGYELFSSYGINGLTIESIAKNINKNKSSFYHFFGDVETFMGVLLEFHLQRSVDLAKLAKNCDKIKPEVLNLLIERKEDIFFHRQLRMHRDKLEYKTCYTKAFQNVEDAIKVKWAEALGLNDQILFAGTLLNLVIENFLLRMTQETFTYEWLADYLEEVRSFVQQTKVSIKPED